MNEPRELNLWDTPGTGTVLQLFPAAGGAARPLIIVLPGGGYATRAPHEAGPVARWLNRAGLHAAVCHYRVAPNRHPAPLSDAQRAVRAVRHNAGAWGVDPDRVGVLGFSAGGHLACCCANFGDDGLPEGDAISRVPSRVNALVACYPVVSIAAAFAHAGSAENLLGPDPDPALVLRLSLENSVTRRNPPAFLWHSADDAAVDVRNPLAYAAALAAFKIPFALHVYPSAPHGAGLAEHLGGTTRNWTRDCAEWLSELNWRQGPP